MPVVIDDKFIQPYLDPLYPKHLNYNKTIEIQSCLQIHSKGLPPTEILNIDRPNEDAKYKAYRSNKAVFSPITKSKWGQISSTTDKIAMAEDWGIKFPDPASTIAKGESLEDYTTKNYPIFDSVVNWYFTIAKKRMEDDPNGVVAIFPTEDVEDETEYLQPFTFIFPSECIIEYKEDQFCAIKCKEKSIVKLDNQPVRSGDIYMFFDKNRVIKAEQTGDINIRNFLITTTEHNIGSMPVFKLGGVVESFEDGQVIYESFYTPVVPYFNEALARYSDQQINMILHIHPDRWEMKTTDCKVCKGNGTTIINNQPGPCQNCDGGGKVSVKGPGGVTYVNPSVKKDSSNSTPVPTPPMGYATRPIESLEFLKKEINDLVSEGFNSLNLGFLNETPEVNSGVAKVMDRQDMNAFFRSISRHIIENNLKPVFYFINEWRYSISVPSEEKRNANLPVINIPEKFDILTADVLADRLRTAIDGKFHSSLLTKLQIEYAESEFGKEALEVQKMKLIAQHDPLPNKGEDEKMTILANKGTTLAKYVLSSNIDSFINRLVDESEDFLQLSFDDVEEKLLEYAQEIISENTPKVIPLIPDFAGPNAPSSNGRQAAANS